MGTYYIVPKDTVFVVDSDSKEDAIVDFATSMDTDMNIYFDVLSKEEAYAKLYKED